MMVKPGATRCPSSRSRERSRASRARSKRSRVASVPQWLETDKDAFEGTVKRCPVARRHHDADQEQLIVELYSR